MKYLTAIEDRCYLLWQLEVQLRNLEELGELPRFVGVLLYQQPLSGYARELLGRYPANLVAYEQPERLPYLAAHKPLGVARYLEEHPADGARLLLLDSDIIFRERLDFTQFEQYSYHYLADMAQLTGYHAMRQELSEEQLRELTAIVGVSLSTVKARTYNSGGGTYYLKNIDAAFCHKVARDAQRLYAQLLVYRAAGSAVQTWIAEMWAWLWNLFLIGNTRVHSELAFAWGYDPMHKVLQCKTLHLAGVEPDSGLFYKGYYTDCKPWEAGRFDYATNHDSGAHYYLRYLLDRFAVPAS